MATAVTLSLNNTMMSHEELKAEVRAYQDELASRIPVSTGEMDQFRSVVRSLFETAHGRPSAFVDDSYISQELLQGCIMALAQEGASQRASMIDYLCAVQELLQEEPDEAARKECIRELVQEINSSSSQFAYNLAQFMARAC